MANTSVNMHNLVSAKDAIKIMETEAEADSLKTEEVE